MAVVVHLVAECGRRVGRPGGFEYVDGRTEVEADHWYHMVQVYDGSALLLYVDGELDAEMAQGHEGTVVSGAPLILAKDDRGAGRSYLLTVAFEADQPPRFRAHIGRPGGLEHGDGAPQVEPERWYHVVQVYDGSDLLLYVNGELEGRGVQGHEALSPARTLWSSADVCAPNDNPGALNAEAPYSWGTTVPTGGRTNILNRPGVGEDPWIGFSGTHAENLDFMFYGVGNAEQIAQWLGVHIYIR